MTGVPGARGSSGNLFPLCSIVVLNYNGREYLDGCLTSVLAQEYPAFEVILVDNGSDDGSADYVRRAYPLVRVLQTGTNLGYSAGNNAGVTFATGDWIVLLNNDTVVQPGWLSGLVAAAREPDVAIVSSLVLTEGIPDRYYERNGSINFLCHNIMRVFDRPENIFYGGGASLLFKKEFLGKPFDDDYFAYAEDVYLSLRARFMGYRVLHANASVVRHLGGATAAKQQNSFVTYLQERNRILTILLFFSSWTLLRIAPFVMLNAVAKILTGLASPRRSLVGILEAYRWLLLHGSAIRMKRKVLARERGGREQEVVSWMTGKLTNGETSFGRLVNYCALGYCRLVGLRTVDFLPAGLR